MPLLSYYELESGNEASFHSYYKVESGNGASFHPFQYENAPALIL